MIVEEVDSKCSPDITSLEITEGGNWVSRPDLELLIRSSADGGGAWGGVEGG